MNINEKIKSINSREEFIQFLDALRFNLSQNPSEWKNLSLEDFLEALSGWTQDMDGYYKNNNMSVPLSPSWRSLAEMFVAAKYYE